MTEEQIRKAFENRWRIKVENNPKYSDFIPDIKEICLDFFRTGILIAEKPVQDDSPVRTPLEIRAESFCKSLNTTEYLQNYGQQMLKDFYDYWTEPNPSGTKMRFELQKTWDLSRRLARWARNNFNRYDRQQQPTIEQQRVDKLATIIAG